jgi:hypothetical protein
MSVGAGRSLGFGEQIATDDDKLLAFLHPLMPVHLQQLNGCSPFRRQPYEDPLREPKVVMPTLRAGIEQETELSRLWIERRQIGALVPVTSPARQGEIGRFGPTAMLLRDHVIHLVWEEDRSRWKEAVLAALGGPFFD